MKEYAADQIRNVALVGHSGAGKTALAEAALYLTKAITRIGKTEEGNTTTDFDEEEIRRGISINVGLAPVEYRDHKINIVDTPGYADFVGEMIGALDAVEFGLVVVDSVSGVEVGTELAWKALDEAGLPRAVVINRMDRENARWERVLADLRRTFEGVRFVPLQLPIGQEADFRGIYRLIGEKASIGEAGDEGEVPAEVLSQAESLRDEIVEAAAESIDELLMKFFDGVELTNDEIRHGLEQGAMSGKYVPVFFSAATSALGVDALLNSLLTIGPRPSEEPRTGRNQATDEEVELASDPAGPLAVRVFKTMADPYVGKLQYVRVFSGTFAADSRVHNQNQDEEERIGPLYVVRGKEQITVGHIPAGDIGAVAKLQHTSTFDTLGDGDAPIVLPAIELPQPLFAVSVSPVTKSDGAKLGQAIHRLVEEDPSLRSEFEGATRELILSGMGDAHIDVAVRRLKEKFGVDVQTAVPRVPYRETITRSATAAYRHKKQTGGAGQFAEVHLRVEPLESGAGFEYTSEVVGGAISSTFIPSIEKGINQILDEGIIAHCPVVDVRAVVYDGKEHPVDSKDIAFQIAGRGAFKEAFLDGGPALLEPIYTLRITVPSEQMGDVLGDINTRRGMVQGTEQIGGRAVVTVQAPLAEIQRYPTDLRSMTQGRGYFTADFSHYARVPQQVAQGVIAATAAAAEDED